MSQQSYLIELREEHVDAAADCITKSFLGLNNIWKKYGVTHEDLKHIIRGKVVPAVKQGYSFVLMKNCKVIGVALQYELLDYLQTPNMPNDLQLFKDLAMAGKRLESQLDLSDIKRGDAIYGLYGVIDPDEASKGHSLKFWWNQFAIGAAAGWKYYYSRISSAVSLKMLKQLGAEELGQATVQGTNQKLWMIRIELKNLPTYAMMDAMNKMKRGQKAKL